MVPLSVYMSLTKFSTLYSSLSFCANLSFAYLSGLTERMNLKALNKKFSTFPELQEYRFNCSYFRMTFTKQNLFVSKNLAERVYVKGVIFSSCLGPSSHISLLQIGRESTLSRISPFF